jgi:uncharacterized membrane protein
MSENSKTKERSKLRLTALCGVFAALVFIGTQIRIPTAIGYINLGDGVILIASYFIGPAAFFPGAIGSALSDLIAGYPMYIAPTFLIKGLMGLAAALIMTASHGKKAPGIVIRLAAFLGAELIMVGGYFVFEALYYDIAAAAGSVVFNLIQAGAAVVIAIPLTYAINIRKKR